MLALAHDDTFSTAWFFYSLLNRFGGLLLHRVRLLISLFTVE